MSSTQRLHYIHSCIASTRRVLLIGSLWLAVALSLRGQAPVAWQEIPNVQLSDSTRFVSDVADVVSPTAEQEIDDTLRRLRQQHGVEGVVVVLPSLGEGQLIEDLSLQILREWGVGSRIDHSGFVLLASIADRKVRIETGYGLEGILPDALCSDIIAEEIAPHFRNKDYSTGLVQAIGRISEVVSEGYDGATRTDQAGARGRKDSSLPLSLILSGGLLSIILIFMIGAVRDKSHSPSHRLKKIDSLFAVFSTLILPLSLGQHWGITGVSFGLMGLGYGLLRSRVKRLEHTCPHCHEHTLQPLDSTATLRRLSDQELLEEKLGSVRHRIFHCTSCGTEQHYRDVETHTAYKRCPHCGTYALRPIQTRQLRDNSLRGTIIERTHYRCQYCGSDHHEDRRRRDDSQDAALIGVLLGSALSRGRGFGGGGFGGFGGGGFGGGSGGGGGATGSW